MEQYISKSALVAEIKRRIKTNKECMLGLRNLDYYQGKIDALSDTISFLDTIEVKLEVQEEPASEDLEEIAWNHADKKCHLDIAVFTPDEVKKERGKIQFTWQDLYDAVMFGAQSQKAKDQEIIELARDLRYKENLEVKEVDLEKELIDYHNENFDPCNDGTLLSNETGSELAWYDYERIAKHFFELGLRYNSSYVSMPNIDDTLKEMGVDPDSKIVKIFKESYYMALEKLKEKKGI